MASGRHGSCWLPIADDEPVERWTWTWDDPPSVVAGRVNDNVEIPLNLDRAVTMTAHYTFAMPAVVRKESDYLRAELRVAIMDRVGSVGWATLARSEAHWSDDEARIVTDALRVSSPMGDRAKLAVALLCHTSAQNRFSSEDCQGLMVTDFAVEVLVRNL